MGMRVLLVALAGLLVLACDDNSEAIEKAREEGRAEAQRLAFAESKRLERKASYEKCLSDVSSARHDYSVDMKNARNLVMSKLEGVSHSGSDGNNQAGFAFAVEIESLTENEWAWVEAENQAATDGRNGAALSDRISYEVDPRQLSATVKVVDYRGLPGVRIDCKSGNCIRARGRRVAYYNGENGFEDIDERRDHNVWAVGNGNSAQVVRDGLVTLIRGIATGEPNHTCTPPDAADDTMADDTMAEDYADEM